MRKSRFVLAALFFGLFSSACLIPPRAGLEAPEGWRTIATPEFLGGEKNITVQDLERDSSASWHLVRIRDAETLHVHARHELEAVLLEGRGTFQLDGRSRPARAGDRFRVSAGRAHRFVNEGDFPAIAYVRFTPPFDGKDIVPVETPGPGVSR